MVDFRIFSSNTSMVDSRCVCRLASFSIFCLSTQVEKKINNKMQTAQS